MAFWCIVLIVLGFWGLLRDLVALDVPGLLNPVANVAIMLVALGLLIRTRAKQRAGTIEKLTSRIAELEDELESRIDDAE